MSERRAQPSRRLHPQRGFTLVELMVAVTLSLLIVLALLTLLINVNRNQAELARTNSVIENGRMAQQLVAADLGHAGFWGGYVPTFDDLSIAGDAGTANSATTVAFPTALPDPCAAVSTWNTDYKAGLIGIPLQVYEVSATGDSPVCSGIITPAVAQPNSDVLVVRHAAPCVASASAGDPECLNTAGNMFFQLSRCPNDAATWILSATAADLALKDATCTAAAPLYRFTSTIYWVRNYFITPGDSVPTLVRTRFQLAGGSLGHQQTETLVDGVQALRLQLAVDNVSKPATAGGTGTALNTASFQRDVGWSSTSDRYTPTNRGDGNADTYLTCADAAAPCSDPAQGPFNLANTVAVTVGILARAGSPTPGYVDAKTYSLAGSTVAPFNDHFKRHVYTDAIRLNNVSMRREVPPP
ncbi:PilW family protein [Ramlibacter sp.]|uniref:PilW family protein n=1 Tax=Ramlibacter sp. TaxID=1917967 RepID=UPI00261A6F31|nr:PilW family protein [Ramlibacter sp.]MDB5954833.1 putative type 4 fimbrial biosis pilw-related protein transrane [Ramlibacter sp.]